jgi:hypothetical protein
VTTTKESTRAEPSVPKVRRRDIGPWVDWPWERILAWAGLLVVAACCAFVFLQLRPELLFRDTTPSGGDTAAHVWWPAYLRDHLLPWRLAGWSPDFYAGFPAGQFYFPVPALLIVGLDVVLPYNVAFKLITALGPVVLPLGAYIFARGIRAPRPTPAAFAVAATAFLFFTGDPGSTSAAQSVAFNQHIMGGTLASTLAGEFSFTIALAGALAFFGTLAYSLRTGRRMWLPAVLLAATVMSHLVVGIFVAMGAFVVWLASRPLKTAGRATAIGIVGFFLSALWLLPLLATLGYTTDMRYGAITQYTDYLFPSYIFGIHGAWPWEWGAYALIAIAAVGAIIEKQRSTFQLVMLTSLAGLTFRLWESLQSTTVWNLRLLPFWYLCIFLLMATGVAELLRGLAWSTRRAVQWWQVAPGSDDPGSLHFVPGFRSERPRRRVSPTTAGAVCLVVLTVACSVVVLRGIRYNEAFLPDWISWNYRGYQYTVGDAHAGPKSYAEYQAFIDTAAKLPAGRLLWEGNQQLDTYGSPLALMLLPYWTHGRIASMEGVYYEASATTPYHFIATSTIDGPGNASNAVGGISYGTSTELSTRGVPYLELLGVRYLAPGRAPRRWPPATRGHRPRSRRQGAQRMEHLRGARRPAGRPVAVPAGGRRPSLRGRPAGVPEAGAAHRHHLRRTPDPRLAGLHRRALVLQRHQPRPTAGRCRSVGVAPSGLRGRAGRDEAGPAGRDREPDQEHRRHGVVPRLPRRRPGLCEDVVVPELAGRRRDRAVPVHAELHGRGAHQQERDPSLRHDHHRVGRSRRNWGRDPRCGRAGGGAVATTAFPKGTRPGIASGRGGERPREGSRSRGIGRP